MFYTPAGKIAATCLIGACVSLPLAGNAENFDFSKSNSATQEQSIIVTDIASSSSFIAGPDGEIFLADNSGMEGSNLISAYGPGDGPYEPGYGPGPGDGPNDPGDGYGPGPGDGPYEPGEGYGPGPGDGPYGEPGNEYCSGPGDGPYEPGDGYGTRPDGTPCEPGQASGRRYNPALILLSP
jgi:hypothetical protein